MVMHEALSQPVWSGDALNKSIGGFKIIHDLKIKSKYYYLPTDITFALEPSGKPKFKLFSVKYTPQSPSSQNSKVKYLNIFEMTVHLRQPNAEDLIELKSSIPANSTLENAPLDHVDIDLTIPSENKSSAPIKLGSTTLNDGSNINAAEGFWQEKTFSLRLDNYEMQQLESILNQRSLALSLHYRIWAYGAVIIFLEASNTIQIKKEQTIETVKFNNLRPATHTIESPTIRMGSNYEKADTVVKRSIVFTNSLALHPDMTRWPDLREKKDFLDFLPARYSSMKVACYDFVHQTRPDLAYKKVTFKAISDNNQPIDPIYVEYHNTDDQDPIAEVRFPLPVHINKPIQYQVEEVYSTGQRTKSKKQTYITNDLIDVSATQTHSTLEQRSFDIELNYNDSLSARIINPSVHIEYYFQNTKKTEVIPFNKPDFQSMNIWMDKNSSVTIYPVWFQNGAKWHGKEKRGQSDYYLLQI